MKGPTELAQYQRMDSGRRYRTICTVLRAWTVYKAKSNIARGYGVTRDSIVKGQIEFGRFGQPFRVGHLRLADVVKHRMRAHLRTRIYGGLIPCDRLT